MVLGEVDKVGGVSVTPAKELNISPSGLDIAEKLEQKISRGTLLPFLASDHHSSRRFFWSSLPPPPDIKAYL